MTLSASLRKRRYRQRNRANGRCIRCGKPALLGYTRCAPCTRIGNALTAAYTARNKAAGLCANGGARHGPAASGRTLCAPCLETQRLSVREARHEREVLGLCVASGCTRNAVAGVVCVLHLLHAVQRHKHMLARAVAWDLSIDARAVASGEEVTEVVRQLGCEVMAVTSEAWEERVVEDAYEAAAVRRWRALTR